MEDGVHMEEELSLERTPQKLIDQLPIMPDM
jgi:hypothetical protein